MGREEDRHNSRGHRSRSRSPASRRGRSSSPAGRRQHRHTAHMISRDDAPHRHSSRERAHRRSSRDERRRSRSKDRAHRSRSRDKQRRSSIRERPPRNRSQDRQHHSPAPRRKRSRSPSDAIPGHRHSREAPAARAARYPSPPASPGGRGYPGQPRSPLHRAGSGRHEHRNRSPSPKPQYGGAVARLPGPPITDEPPAVGSIHQGAVHTIRPFGLFVAVDGYRRHVLVHHTQVADDITLTREDEDDIKVKALEFAAPKGQRVYVKILEVAPDPQGSGFRVHGSMRAVSQQDGTDLDPQNLLAVAQRGAGGGGPLSDEPPEENSIHRAVVKRVEPYGVFVALDGHRKHGLVHSSQVSNYLSFSAEDTDEEKKAAMLEVVHVGDVVWVKVVEVSDDGSGRGPRIGCSMKLVNQSDGQDLDPMGSRYKPRGEAGGPRGRGAPIGADAGEVVRGGKVDWGYLQADTKQYNGKQYDLLDEEAPKYPGPPRGGADAGPSGRPPLPQHGAPPALTPAGRGRGAVVPAWMTSGGSAATPAAPGSTAAGGGSANGADAAGSRPIGSVEEALAILNELKALNKHKKSKKSKKHQKHKKHKSSRKKEGKRRHSDSGSSSSDGSSDRSK